jgi:hypothetical protein
MPQSTQDDRYDALELFAEQSYVFLVLLALQHRLTPDEAYLLEKAARVAAMLRSVPVAA